MLSERPKLHTILTFLSAIGLNSTALRTAKTLRSFGCSESNIIGLIMQKYGKLFKNLPCYPFLSVALVVILIVKYISNAYLVRHLYIPVVAFSHVQTYLQPSSQDWPCEWTLPLYTH